MKMDWEAFKNRKFVVNCEDSEERRKFCNLMMQNGMKIEWHKKTPGACFGSKTCFTAGVYPEEEKEHANYGSLEFYEGMEIKVIKFSKLNFEGEKKMEQRIIFKRNGRINQGFTDGAGHVFGADGYTLSQSVEDMNGWKEITDLEILPDNDPRAWQTGDVVGNGLTYYKVLFSNGEIVVTTGEQSALVKTGGEDEIKVWSIEMLKNRDMNLRILRGNPVDTKAEEAIAYLTKQGRIVDGKVLK